jgi:uncharacterized membrane protein
MPKPTDTGKPWAFVPTLRLSAAALLLAMLSLLVEGLTSSALVISAAILVLLGIIEFVQAWRWRLTHAEDQPRDLRWRDR